jgi:transcription elongation GreA/GreB family factor
MMNKEILKKYLLELIDKSIQQVSDDLVQVQKAANEETKSSAGDKYETGRAMAQLEIEKLTKQKAVHLQNKEYLIKIDVNRSLTNIQVGSLLQLNKQIYFISVSMGKIILDQQSVFCISNVSPIGQALIGKTKGEKIQWNNQTLMIEEVF